MALSKRILIIDDNQMLTAMIAHYMRQKGYEVWCAPDGNAGLIMLQGQRPDLVILDIEMPKKDGLEVYNEISTPHGLSKIPVLIMTGRGELKEVFEQIEVDGFIGKPFEMNQFLAEVERILKNQFKGHVFLIDIPGSAHTRKLADALEEERYKVTYAESLSRFREYAEQSRPRFVFMEYMQQSSSGEEMIRQLKKILPGNVPLLVYTSSGMDFREKSLKAGADKYVGCPSQCEQIMDQIRELELSGPRG